VPLCSAHAGVDSLRLFNRRMSTFVPWAARTVVQALAESQHATSGGRVRDSADWVRNGTFQLIGLDFMVDEVRNASLFSQRLLKNDDVPIQSHARDTSKESSQKAIVFTQNMEFSFIEGNPRPGLDQETRWQSRYMVDMVVSMRTVLLRVDGAERLLSPRQAKDKMHGFPWVRTHTCVRRIAG
jgi:hypothetical protein